MKYGICDFNMWHEITGSNTDRPTQADRNRHMHIDIEPDLKYVIWLCDPKYVIITGLIEMNYDIWNC